MDWTALIGQIPLVAAFIWFSLEQQKRFDSALDKRDTAFERRNDKVCKALDDLTHTFIDHDERVRVLTSEVHQYMGIERRKNV